MLMLPTLLKVTITKRAWSEIRIHNEKKIIIIICSYIRGIRQFLPFPISFLAPSKMKVDESIFDEKKNFYNFLYFLSLTHRSRSNRKCTRNVQNSNGPTILAEYLKLFLLWNKRSHIFLKIRALENKWIKIICKRLSNSTILRP